MDSSQNCVQNNISTKRNKSHGSQTIEENAPSERNIGIGSTLECGDVIVPWSFFGETKHTPNNTSHIICDRIRSLMTWVTDLQRKLCFHVRRNCNLVNNSTTKWGHTSREFPRYIFCCVEKALSNLECYQCKGTNNRGARLITNAKPRKTIIFK